MIIGSMRVGMQVQWWSAGPFGTPEPMPAAADADADGSRIAAPAASIGPGAWLDGTLPGSLVEAGIQLL